MNRARWWNVRPARRSLSSRPRRARFTADDLAGEWMRGWDQAQEDARTLLKRDGAYELGYEAGRADEAQHSENRDRQIRRLMDAIDASEQGDPRPLAEIGRHVAADDLLDVADAAGVTPMEVADGGLLVDELEAWLARRGDEA